MDCKSFRIKWILHNLVIVARRAGQAVCRYDTIRSMKAILVLATMVLGTGPAAAQATDPVVVSTDPIVVSTEHPRLFLRPARLRLLRRERERASLRWEQFDALMSGGAPMPEPGFAGALYYQIAGDKAVGRKAIAWALGPDADLRQMALVYDWCQDLLGDAERQNFAARLSRRMTESAADAGVAAARSRALAAVALFDDFPDTPPRELDRLVRQWWGGKIAPALNEGHHIVSRDDAYPLYELLHAMQDNVKLDLRESNPRFFKEYPIEHLLSYYPAPYPAQENDYFIGAESKPGEPDLRLAALSRAAELAMVAYDPNGPETQVLQGWLMHDKYLMRGEFGTPYEFLWANPYQPGLSYYHVPLVYYAPEFGRLFVRSNWDDAAQWFGFFDGAMQTFGDGKVSVIDPQRPPGQMNLTEALICFGKTGGKFHFNLEEPEAVFILGLEPKRIYQVEVDDEELAEVAADPSGILELDDVPAGKAIGVRIR
jgi:hypothetical protein